MEYSIDSVVTNENENVQPDQCFQNFKFVKAERKRQLVVEFYPTALNGNNVYYC